ncbi:MAG: YARHG domain-containing protein [Lachnospiraceae bacterium]|nr:MAG: YARHG domain-containing protein [Lachnospiraceae bacterium]
MLQEYFDLKFWYSILCTPDEFSQIESSTFNEYEKENIKFLSGLIS